jgi:hypothetical protein
LSVFVQELIKERKTPPMPLHWYALRTKARKEDAVWQQLRDQGIEHYYPRVRAHPVNPRARKIKPYFPGYLFIRVDLGEKGHSAFQWMPHSLGLVSFGEEPARIPDNVMYEMKQRVQEIADAGGELFDGLRPVTGRSGAGRRAWDEIGIHAVRAGGIYGEHEFIAASEHEVIRVRHALSSRAALARGALAAARFAARAEAGLYSMEDVWKALLAGQAGR